VPNTVSADRSNGDKLLCMPAEVMGTSCCVCQLK
jgi:hypothetical protein